MRLHYICGALIAAVVGAVLFPPHGYIGYAVGVVIGLALLELGVRLYERRQI